MRFSFKNLLFLFPLLAILVVASGCGEQVPAEVLAIRSRLLLDEEPTGAITIEQAREQVAESPGEMVLIVRVGNRNITTWSSKDEATFFVSEGFPDSDYNIGPDHDPSTCPFCKWKWKEEDSLAIIKVVDASGNVVPYSAEQIFDFKPEDFVVVTGSGELDEVGTLNVQLDGLYKRPST
ncbi:hypothetical protein [Thalassoglobus polymorphus]|uniref:Lipoprotein n=1 Tax=Thalassoglobus polymorphus TaxID=2527994 RepID=A0A517QUT8_9PLAN|nr:hypothetical protein [Thalassoglobus polymorphus]QDT35396.1 hypothetical protein Mal48_46730 [Thalassoglobus polymorphus]